MFDRARAQILAVLSIVDPDHPSTSAAVTCNIQKNMLRISCINFRTSASRQDTLARATALVKQAVFKFKAETCVPGVVVLPECWTGEYGVTNFEKNAERFMDQESGTRLMSELASELGIYVIGGVIEQTTDALFNSVFAFNPEGSAIARYRKLHLSRVTFGEDRTSEGTVLCPGNKLACFDVGTTGFRVGLLNCFDLRFPAASRSLRHQADCNVLVYPSAWLKSSGELGHWETLLKARALDNQVYVAGINVARNDAQDVVCFGHTQVIDPLGQVLALTSDHFADDIVTAKLSLSAIENARARVPLDECARTDIFETDSFSSQIININKI